MVENDLKIDVLKTAFDALPSLIFVVDEDVKIQFYNKAAADLLSSKKEDILKHRAGDVLHCLHSTESLEGCGNVPICKKCIIRNSVKDAFHGTRVVRKLSKMETLNEKKKIDIYAMITATPFQYQEKNLVLLIVEDISDITELQRIIPICSFCHKIRDKQETWDKIEAYFYKCWDLEFSHSICPECMKENYPEINKKMNNHNNKKYN